MFASSSSGRAIDGGVFTLPDPATFNMGLQAWYHDGPDERYEDYPNNRSWVSFTDQDGEYFLTLGTPDPIESATIQILDMVAYTGGDSLSERPFPEIRYQFTASDPNVDVEKINFTIFGDEYSLKHNIDLGIAEEVSNGVYIIHASDIEGAFELPVIFTLGGVEAEDDSEPGEYVIDLAAWAKTLLLWQPITAEYEGRDITEVEIVPGTLTVHHVSEPEEVLDEDDPLDIATPVLSEDDEVSTDGGMAVAVIPEGAVFYTNGKEALGLLGDSDDPDSPLISLMFDELIARDAILEGEATTADLLIARAEGEGLPSQMGSTSSNTSTS